MERKFKFENNTILLRKNSDTIELIIIEDDTLDKYHCVIGYQSIFEQSKQLIKSIDLFFSLLSKKLEEENGIKINKIDLILVIEDGNTFYQLFFKFDLIFSPATRDEALKESICQIRERLTKMEKDKLKTGEQDLLEEIQKKQLEISDIKHKFFSFMEKSEQAIKELQEYKAFHENSDECSPIFLPDGNCIHHDIDHITNTSGATITMDRLSIFPRPHPTTNDEQHRWVNLSSYGPHVLGNLKKLTCVQIVCLTTFIHIRNLEFLPEKSPIKIIQLIGCVNLNDISFISKLKKLEEIVISSCQNITSLECLDQHPTLKNIIIRGNTPIKNVIEFQARNLEIKIRIEPN